MIGSWNSSLMDGSSVCAISFGVPNLGSGTAASDQCARMLLFRKLVISAAGCR